MLNFLKSFQYEVGLKGEKYSHFETIITIEPALNKKIQNYTSHISEIYMPCH